MKEVAENEKHEKALVRGKDNTKQDYKIYKMAIDVTFKVLKIVDGRKAGRDFHIREARNRKLLEWKLQFTSKLYLR